MKLSIIIPVYNTEKYLDRCLQSVLASTHKDIEVIAVNDGSKDNSGHVLDEYAKIDNRLKVFHIENGGVSNARNVGIKNATGDYITFVDSDDYILPTMYEEMLEIVKETGVDMVTTDLQVRDTVIKNNLEANKVFDKEQIQTQIVPMFSKGNAIGVTEFKNKIVRREVLQTNNIFFNVNFCYQEDLIFMIEVLANASTMYYLPKAFYCYEPSPTGLYSAYRKNSGEMFIKAFKEIKGLIEKYSIVNIDYVNLHNQFLYNVGYYIYRTNNRIEDKQEKIALIDGVLKSEELKNCCEFLVPNVFSFDRRIASAIVEEKYKKAVKLIKFVHSGKAAKLQKFIAKIRGSK